MMLVKKGVKKDDRETRTKLKSLLPGLKERYPEALDQDQWDTITKPL